MKLIKNIGWVVAFLLSLQIASTAEARKKNILWIFSEDLSPLMGCYDCSVNKGHTPVIDGMAKDGVLFKRAFMPAPVCSACRSAIITGVYQTTIGTHQHRSSRTTNPENTDTHIYLPKGMKTVPELMRDAGYFTFNNGKDDYNFFYDRRKLYSTGTKENYKIGLNGWQGNFAIGHSDFNSHTWNSRQDKSQPWFGQITIWGGKAGARYVPKNERLADNAVPLPPYFPQTKDHQKAWTNHYNAARGADHNIKMIIDQLKKDGELENTIIFFFSDHGNNKSLRHKQFCYEGGVHVPLIIVGAGKTGVRNDLVSGLDISATTLSLAGAKMPDHLDGSDLFSTEHKQRDYVISARDRCDYTIDKIRTVRTDKYRYIKNYFPERTMLQAQYRDNSPTVKDLKRLNKEGKLSDYQKQHWFGVRPVEELYDLAKDPHQIHNLAGKKEFQQELFKHREILEKWIKETGDKGQQAEDPKQLKATYDLWKNKAIFKNADTNPEYDQFKK